MSTHSGNLIGWAPKGSVGNLNCTSVVRANHNLSTVSFLERTQMELCNNVSGRECDGWKVNMYVNMKKEENT